MHDQDDRRLQQYADRVAELIRQLVDHDLEYLESERSKSIGDTVEDGDAVAFAERHRRLLGRDRALDEILIRP